MNKPAKIYTWALVIALGGFLFGFDTAVISGAEQAIQRYWSLSTLQHGLTVSIALIGTVIGAITGGIPADKIGRKKTLFLIAGLYLLSSLGTALAGNWILFMVLRFAGGLGVGASSVAAPVYISELSPAASRGKLVALFQFNVVTGILVAYLSNYFIGNIFSEEHAWRFMLGIQALPSLIFILLIRLVPESPRWLILRKGDIIQARQVLQRIEPDNFERTVQDIMQQSSRQATSGAGQRLWSRKYRTPLMLAVLLAVFNQVSGINAIIYYAPRIFEMTGLGRSASLLSTAGIGLVNLVFTLLAINFIDRLGRKKLMLIGSVGLIITLGLVSKVFYMHDFGNMAVVVYLLVYIAFFAFSQGAVIWVFIAEIFPNQVRAQGQAAGSFTHWFMAALIAFSFPYLAEKAGGGGTFLFFAGMMVLQLLFVLRFMPETKGRSLEQVETGESE